MDKIELKTPPVENQTGRLDKFLVSCFPEFSRNQFIHLIEAKAVCVKDHPERLLQADSKILKGDVYLIVPPDPIDADPQPENIPLDIYYEDNDLLVVNKPAGLVVHPGAGNWSGTMVNALLFHCGNSLSGIGGVKRPGIVHRIDKDTSGLLVIAKNDLTHQGLSQQFSVHSIERIYQAFVWGMPNDQGTVVGNIGRSSSNRQKMALVSQGGKSAITHYKRLAVYGGMLASHIQCILETGRTHQIRVHMSSIQHSLIGDSLYGRPIKSAPDFLKYFPRQALHAGFLGFIHPRTQQKLTFEAPLPKDLSELKNYLENLK